MFCSCDLFELNLFVMCYKTIPLLILIVSASLLSACKGRSAKANEDNSGMRSSGDTVLTGVNDPAISKLQIAVVMAKDYWHQYTTTGVVRTEAGQMAQISTPFNGRIISSFVNLGQKIQKGAQVFSMTSAEYFDAVRNLRQAEDEMNVAEKNLNRKKDLLDQGVSSKREYEEASLEYERAKKDFETAGAGLKIFNVDPSGADFSSPLIIRSPISGEVVSNSITIGQYLKSDAEPVVVIANLDKVWVVAHVREKDLGSIALKDSVNVLTEGQPRKPVTGNVVYIGKIMEDLTRSVEVFIECVNTSGSLRPGMFVTVHFFSKIEKAILIPSSAILQDEGKSYVFMKSEGGRFIKRTVSVSSEENNMVKVGEGLSGGESIVTEGGIYLR